METQALFLFCEKLSKECVRTFLKKVPKNLGTVPNGFPSVGYNAMPLEQTLRVGVKGEESPFTNPLSSFR